MISAWWLVAGVFGGVIVGMFLMALMAANGEDD